MCDSPREEPQPGSRTIPVHQAVGTVLAHDITEIRPGEFKGRAFRKGHLVRHEDICHLQRLGKDHLYILDISDDEMHEDEAAAALAGALMGEGVNIQGEPHEGKINIVASRDGLLKVNTEALLRFNMLGEVMCATLHTNSIVRRGQVVAGTRAIPLVLKRSIVQEAARIGETVRGAGRGVIEVREIRRPRAGVVITGNEVYYGRIKDAFAPVIKRKIEAVGGEIVGAYYAPDDEAFIGERLRELLNAGADLLITTGGLSVDPDDVTRHAIRKLGADDITYGSAVLPGAMFLVAYLDRVRDTASAKQSEGPAADEKSRKPIPILGIPACGMYADATVFDLVLARVLASERIGRKDLAELGHGGLCLKCEVCRYPVCPFGK